MAATSDPPAIPVEDQEILRIEVLLASGGGDHAWLERLRSCAIADAYARFQRSRGVRVQLSIAGGDEEPENGAGRSPNSLERIGCSMSAAARAPSSAANHRAQQAFLALFDADLVYRDPARGGRWLLRTAPYLDETARSLRDVADDDSPAVARQTAALGRVEGVEVEAHTLDGRAFTVFTPHGDAIARASFVALSPRSPMTDELVPEGERQALAGMRHGTVPGPPGPLPPVIETGCAVQVPGVEGLLPVVVSESVDARIGAGALLGIPDADPSDRAIAAELTPSAAANWTVRAPKGAVRPAVRYRMGDLPISGREGLPVPVAICADCGPVAIPLGEAPADEAPESPACPACGGPAERDTQRLQAELILPTDESGGEAEWRPLDHVVAGPEAMDHILARRVMARALRDVEMLSGRDDVEPFRRIHVHAGVRVRGSTESPSAGDLGSPAELLDAGMGEAVRLALLYAAATRNAFPWTDEPILYCRRFLAELREFSAPRLRQLGGAPPDVDADDRLRRRLALWCRVGSDRIAEDLEALAMHRAVRDAMRLFQRIRDFEERAKRERGELDELDRAAVRAALLVLARQLGPLAPGTAEALWAAAGDPAPAVPAALSVRARPGP